MAITTKINPKSAQWLGASIFGKPYYQISPDIAQALPELFSTLSPKEVSVLTLRYGLDDNQGYGRTLQDVGDILHLSRERIRQIEKRAIRRLRHPIRSRQLRRYILAEPKEEESG